MALSLLAVALIMGVVAPEFPQVIWGTLGGGVFLLIVLAMWWKETILQVSKTSFFKRLTQNALNYVLILGILGLVNFLVYKNDLTLDFTKNKIHSLSDQSERALKMIKGEDKLILKLFAQKDKWPQYHSLLKLYQAVARNKLDLTYIDTNREPALSELYGVKQDGTLVLEYKGKKQTAVATDELAVTNALLKILNPKKRVLYYTVGHNEMSLFDKNLVGGDYLREKILKANFELKALELQNGIPADCNGVLILNPQIEFIESEIKQLDTYLRKGGSLLFSLAPQFNGLMTKNFLKLLYDYGVTYNNALILDRLATQQGSQPSIPVINSYNLDHEITKKQTERTLFPLSGFFSFNESKVFSWTILVKSTPFPASWGEVSFDEVKTGRATYNEATDFKGPLNIMIAGENKSSRIIGFSSASFISNQFQGQTPNYNLFLNSLSWMIKDEALISLDRPKLAGDLVYVSDMQASVVFYFSVLFFPFIFFIIGIIRYRKKLSM